MSRKKYSSNAFISKEQGFSLVELVVVASLLSTILALAYSFWHFGFSSFVSAEKRSDVQQNIRLATDFIHREIRFSSSVALLDAADVPAAIYIRDNIHYILLNNDTTIEYRAGNTSKSIPENIADEVRFALNFTKSGDDLLTVQVHGTVNNAQPISLSSQVRLENLRHFNRAITGSTTGTAIRFERQTFNLPNALSITPSSVIAGTNFSQAFNLALINETFSDSFGINSITLGGDFTGLTVSVIETSNASATVTLSGSLTRTIGSGQIQVAGPGLAGGSALSAQVSVLTDAIFTLNILREGEGATTPAVGSHPYAQDTSVTLTATATEPWQFHQWHIGPNTSSASQMTVLMDNNKTATAHFRRPLTGIPGGSFVSHNGITYLKLTGANNRVMRLESNVSGTWLDADSRPSRSELEGGIWTNSLRIAGVSAYWLSTQHNSERGDFISFPEGTFDHAKKGVSLGVRDALTLPGILFAYSGSGTREDPFILGN